MSHMHDNLFVAKLDCKEKVERILQEEPRSMLGFPLVVWFWDLDRSIEEVDFGMLYFHLYFNGKAVFRESGT